MRTKRVKTIKVKDTRKRNFLKLLGGVALGLFATSLATKKADALIMGGTPSTSVLGLRDASNVRINPATEDTLEKIPGLAIPIHDYISLAQDTLTDTYTYKTGGVGGTTVATVTITYTDSAKGTISNVAKT